MNALRKLTLLGLAFQFASLTGCAQKAASAAATAAAEEKEALAFPGAEGFGKYATGGRGGQVVVVTNLNDNGPGSLREAVRKKGPRIIVFAVSGNIDLESPLDINNGDLTIAGQSAPGDGICLRNYPVSIKADNVIVRYMRFRMGDKAAQQADAVGANKGMNNIIIDHCSMSWATDECASFYYNKNFTLQWCIISESLNASVHAKGEHGYGGIWGGRGASFHHNLLASHNSRNPRFSGSKSVPNPPDELVDFTNNVVYNWGHNSTYGGEKGRYNMVNNYYKSGLATQESKRDRIVNPSAPYGKFYVAGNYVDGFPAVTKNNWHGGVQPDHKDSVQAAKAEKQFTVVSVPTQEPQAAFEAVLSQAGASLKRDAVDARIVQEVRAGRSTNGKHKNGIIDSQQDVGGWPELKSLPAPADKDQDGMPDAWEQQHKLNPGSAADASAKTLSKFYTNVEVYLNSLVK
ncbi:pectate lyase family protein [Rufibacter quisquiliarum]|uniref:Pectate lyase n=1 Tax=Rufibacter quisquiliarum TaxID=1549639 RepID=A0A839GD80_9BACT|nr:pectate lyase [Rufibacter quisquiliarum]MBA9076350.1 pectate lyase [Rufibacter quisquiliarum]